MYIVLEKNKHKNNLKSACDKICTILGLSRGKKETLVEEDKTRNAASITQQIYNQCCNILSCNSF